ncbi:MAG TPA: lysophospholipid acyltransferase family protein [Moraxellaceae bacterium]|nr:lysophospholipid acyltransferase family protein [Moraxellaceae bacterium]
MTEFRPFSPAVVTHVMALRRRYFRPEFVGLADLDLGKPALFVGNHTLYGLLDVPLMVEHLYVQHGVYLRALGDRGHFSVPLWRDYLVRGGMVLGTPENCDALMRAGESVLVFPGGAREVMRRRGEDYQLIWKKRLGFVRQAVKHGYDIVPFGSLGADECYTILADANDVQERPWLRRLIKSSGLESTLRGGDMIPPLGRGIGPTLLPRPQRFYFGFAERISTAHLRAQEHNEAVLWDVREQVAAAINGQIESLRKMRELDRAKGWSWLRRHLAPPSAI